MSQKKAAVSNGPESLNLPPISLVRSLTVSMAVLAVSLPLLACRSHPWYLVESNFAGSTLAESTPAISATGTYYKVVRPGIAVALGAPDACADQSPAEATGEGRPVGETLGTTCGVEMAEIERRLVEAGFRVVSWNAVRDRARYSENTTPLDAAKGFGATVLLQVNSLDRSVSNEPGSRLSWSHEFRESGPDGHRGPTTTVPAETATTLTAMTMQQLEQRAEPRQQLAVTASATAISVGTGEAIWFYSWTHRERIEGSLGASQLFVCNQRDGSRCFQKMPRSLPSVASGPPQSGSSGTVTNPRQDDDWIAAKYHQLATDAIEDMVQRFGQ